MPARTYRSRKAFDKSAAYVHIHHVPHHPSRIEHLKGGKVRVIPCYSCGRESSHMHGRHGCCGAAACHGTMSYAHAFQGERNITPSSMSLVPRGIAKKRGGFGGVFD